MLHPPIYFYPHSYLRDRQLDTIKQWDESDVLNRELAERGAGAQVSREAAISRRVRISWKSRLPLLNVKLRPAGLPKSVAVYSWGSILATGPFILDLDNPYALTGYNLRAMSFYRFIIRRILESSRCLKIHCLSEACLRTLETLFGPKVAAKASVRYPRLNFVGQNEEARKDSSGEIRFLFVGTQFEIKGGSALLRAFGSLYQKRQNVRLDLVTHLPAECKGLAEGIPGVHVHEANYSRSEISERFLRKCDVLVHPTYVESFGMILLEALAHGCAIIATDVYAIGEMLEDGKNGILLKPPISIWNGVLPSEAYFRLHEIKSVIARRDTSSFERQLAQAMEAMAADPSRLKEAQRCSLELYRRRFAHA